MAETSEFLAFLSNFNSYLKLMSDGTVERIKDPEDQEFARLLSRTVVTIGENLEAEFSKAFEEADEDVQASLDRATKIYGANTLTGDLLSEMQPKQAKKGGFWKKIIEIVEALKKILRDILNLEIFGVSLSDILGGVIDIDGILRVLDNIIQTIGDLFGGRALAQKMYDIEMRNVKMTIELTKLRKLRHT